MPFNPHLKNALIRKGGKVSPDDNSVSFCHNNDILVFAGTDEDDMIPDLDGIKHERVYVTRNGKSVNLSTWLSDESPILMTGKSVVKNKNGKVTDCSKICFKILKDLGFKE
jgi:hypothetical protein